MKIFAYLSQRWFKILNLNPSFFISQMAWNGQKSHADVPLDDIVNALTYSARYFEKKKQGE
jgi:hypothetical protein